MWMGKKRREKRARVSSRGESKHIKEMTLQHPATFYNTMCMCAHDSQAGIYIHLGPFVVIFGKGATHFFNTPPPSLPPPPCLLPNSSSLYVWFYLPALVLLHAHIYVSATKCRGSFAKALPTHLFCKCDLTSDGAHQLLPTHTGTHSNAEQRIATHCNTLQHTATPCNTLQHVPPRFPSLSFPNVSPVSLRFLDFWDKLRTHRMKAKQIVGLSAMQAINNLWIHTHTHRKHPHAPH